jgi:hypothetical protein
MVIKILLFPKTEYQKLPMEVSLGHKKNIAKILNRTLIDALDSLKK